MFVFVCMQAAWRILADYREAGPNARIYGGVPEKRSPLTIIFQPCNVQAQVCVLSVCVFVFVLSVCGFVGVDDVLGVYICTEFLCVACIVFRFVVLISYVRVRFASACALCAQYAFLGVNHCVCISYTTSCITSHRSCLPNLFRFRTRNRQCVYM